MTLSLIADYLALSVSNGQVLKVHIHNEKNPFAKNFLPMNFCATKIYLLISISPNYENI